MLEIEELCEISEDSRYAELIYVVRRLFSKLKDSEELVYTTFTVRYVAYDMYVCNL